MAWASVGSLGANNKKTAGTTVVITTTAAAAAGSVVIVVVSGDNVGTTDGDLSETNAPTDSAGGNTWTKAKEFVNGQGAAAAGAMTAIWYSKLTNAIANGGTITANFANSIAAKNASAWNFTIGTGARILVSGSATLAVDAGSDPGSMSISGLKVREYLMFRGIARESGDTTALSPTTSYTAITGTQTSGGLSPTNIGARGEFRIITGTGDTSNPTQGETNDYASVYVALHETPGSPPPQHTSQPGGAYPFPMGMMM